MKGGKMEEETKYIYADEIEYKSSREAKEDNEIRIGESDIRVYLGQCAIDFQKYDELILSAGESFVEKSRTIANILSAVGIVISRKYLSSNNKIRFITEEAEIYNERTSRAENKFIYKLGVIKIPDLFMYTDAEEAIIPKIDNKTAIVVESKKENLANKSNNNTIIIGGERDIRFYLGQCLLSFQRFDEIILSAKEEYSATQNYIAKILKGVGIVVKKEYRDEKGRMRFIADKVEILNERTGRREMKLCTKLGLCKIPEIRMFNDNMEVEDIEEIAAKEEKKPKKQWKI